MRISPRCVAFVGVVKSCATEDRCVLIADSGKYLFERPSLTANENTLDERVPT
jgi:hypothetical protein